MKRTLPATLAATVLSAVLFACTGSFEGGTLDPRVIVSATTATASGSAPLSCSPPALPAAGTPVLLAYSAAGLDAAITSSADPRCARVDVVPLGAPATDLIQTNDGATLYDAIPTLGTVEARGATLAVTGTITADSSTVGGVNAGPICPARLALSPDNLNLAVLDDPSECSGFSRQTLRVLVYRTADLSLRGILTEAVNFSAVNKTGGPAAVAISGSSVWLLAPRGTTFGLYRFDLNAPDLSVATALPSLAGLSLPAAVQAGILVTDTSLLVAPDGRVYAAVNASGQSQGLVVAVNNTQSDFDPPLGAEAAGPANQLVPDVRRGQFLILQPTRTVVHGATNTVVNAVMQAATVALDGFAYGVS
ncbi:MAG TPA: hypothetical protein VHN99_03585, partial [Deinococcales bacterium]|nr:hypothetical protein [Deinococcales bacterium]